MGKSQPKKRLRAFKEQPCSDMCEKEPTKVPSTLRERCLIKWSQDGRIIFKEEGHEYWVDGELFPGTNSCLKEALKEDPFDADKAISRMKPETRKYYCKKDGQPMTNEEIKAEWERRKTTGTVMHSCIEQLLNSQELTEDLQKEYEKEIELFRQHEKQMLEAGWKPFRTEWPIFSREHFIAGTPDIVWYHEKEEKYCVGDWKRVQRLQTQSNYKMKGVFQAIDNSKLNYYLLQVSVYAYILKNVYELDLSLEDSYFCLLHPKSQQPAIYRFSECCDKKLAASINGALEDFFRERAFRRREELLEATTEDDEQEQKQ